MRAVLYIALSHALYKQPMQADGMPVNFNSPGFGMLAQANPGLASDLTKNMMDTAAGAPEGQGPSRPFAPAGADPMQIEFAKTMGVDLQHPGQYDKKDGANFNIPGNGGRFDLNEVVNKKTEKEFDPMQPKYKPPAMTNNKEKDITNAEKWAEKDIQKVTGYKMPPEVNQGVDDIMGGMLRYSNWKDDVFSGAFHNGAVSLGNGDVNSKYGDISSSSITQGLNLHAPSLMELGDATNLLTMGMSREDRIECAAKAAAERILNGQDVYAPTMDSFALLEKDLERPYEHPGSATKDAKEEVGKSTKSKKHFMSNSTAGDANIPLDPKDWAKWALSDDQKMAPTTVRGGQIYIEDQLMNMFHSNGLPNYEKKGIYEIMQGLGTEKIGGEEDGISMVAAMNANNGAGRRDIGSMVIQNGKSSLLQLYDAMDKMEDLHRKEIHPSSFAETNVVAERSLDKATEEEKEEAGMTLAEVIAQTKKSFKRMKLNPADYAEKKYLTLREVNKLSPDQFKESGMSMGDVEEEAKLEAKKHGNMPVYNFKNPEVTVKETEKWIMEKATNAFGQDMTGPLKSQVKSVFHTVLNKEAAIMDLPLTAGDRQSFMEKLPQVLLGSLVQMHEKDAKGMPTVPDEPEDQPQFVNDEMGHIWEMVVEKAEGAVGFPFGPSLRSGLHNVASKVLDPALASHVWREKPKWDGKAMKQAFEVRPSQWSTEDMKDTMEMSADYDAKDTPSISPSQ